MSGHSGRASGADGNTGQLEERIDLSTETSEKIEQAKTLVSSDSSNLRDALAILAALEKRCRVGNDLSSLVRVCEASLKLCHDAGDDESLVATLKSLSTRRSQKSKAIGALVEIALPWVVGEDGFSPLPLAGDGDAETAKKAKAVRDSLVTELRVITDGKMYLEAERARLTRTMAIIYEADGDIASAADTLQEVHVETYGSLSKREKVEFILEQMRLTLAKGDYVRAHIVSNKVRRKQLTEEGMEEEKIKFYTLLGEYHRHEKDAFELAKDFHAMYSTPCVQADDVRCREALASCVVFLALSKYGNEQQDMMNRVNLDPNLEKIPACCETVRRFLKKEIIPRPLPNQSDLESHPSFLAGGPDLATHWKETLRTRIVQHNIRIASAYYRRIRGSRLAELLGLTSEELESAVSDMVSDGTLYAKIDRPNDIVRFAPRKTAEAVLSDWGSDVKTLLHLVEETTHLIHKENMVQSH